MKRKNTYVHYWHSHTHKYKSRHSAIFFVYFSILVCIEAFFIVLSYSLRYSRFASFTYTMEIILSSLNCKTHKHKCILFIARFCSLRSWCINIIYIVWTWIVQGACRHIYPTERCGIALEFQAGTLFNNPYIFELCINLHWFSTLYIFIPSYVSGF